MRGEYAWSYSEHAPPAVSALPHYLKFPDKNRHPNPTLSIHLYILHNLV